jgi:hypothetical protein
VRLRLSASRSALDHVAAHPDMRPLPIRVVVGNWLHAGVSWPRARSARGCASHACRSAQGGVVVVVVVRRGAACCCPYALAADMRELGSEADSIKKVKSCPRPLPLERRPHRRRASSPRASNSEVSIENTHRGDKRRSWKRCQPRRFWAERVVSRQGRGAVGVGVALR